MPIVVTTRGPDGQLVEMPITGDASPEDAAAAAAVTDAPDATASPGTEAQSADSSPAVPTAPASGEDAGDPDEPELPEDAPVTASHFNRRIGQITRYRREAERALATEREERTRDRAELAHVRGQLEVMTKLMQGQSPDMGTPTPPAGPPQAENFQSHDEYITAKAQYEARQVMQQDRQQTQAQQAQEALMAREAAFKAAHPDFDDLVRANLAGKVAPHVQQALMFLPDGPELAYALARQPDALAQLNQLPPPQMLLALGRLSPAPTPQAPAQASATSNGTAPPVPTPATPVLPPPPTPLSGSGQGVPPDTPADWSQAEFTRRWNAGWRPGPRDFTGR